MNKLQLNALRPELIGSIFGRTSAAAFFNLLRSLQPKIRILLVSSLFLVSILLLASLDNSLVGKEGTPSALGQMVHPAKIIDRVQVPLLQDPVGIIVILVAIATPVFCAEQVAAIREFVRMNERNIQYRASSIRINEVNADVARANRQFEMVGSRLLSILFLILAAGSSLLLYSLFVRRGLFRSWNSTSASDVEWSRKTYEGWWANVHHHFFLAVALWSAGTYLFYFLAKQLAMGCVFAVFARSAMFHEFGVAPDMSYNTDGYWGLRPLRRFMQWTYGSTLAHFVATLGVSIVWLPFAQWTVFLVIGVMMANCFVVIYPSSIAYNSAVREKARFVEHIRTSDLSWMDKEGTTEKIWTRPDLPFRTRSTLSALTLYLLVPLVLAVVSSLLSR